VYAFDVPREALRDGETVVEITAPADGGGIIRWVEVAYL
jgi:hypothetical protein